MDTKVLVNAELIATITRLPKVGGDLTPFFARKEQDNSIVTRIKDKHGFIRDKWGFNIASINDQVVWIAAKVLSSKLLRKILLNQCTAFVICCSVAMCCMGPADLGHIFIE